MQKENSNTQGVQTDKFVFGVYLNQARLNAYITLCHISELMGENTVDEDSISEMPVLKFLENNTDAVKSERVFKLIEKHFPMLEIIYESERHGEQKGDLQERTKKYKSILTCLLKALNDKRNEYCHAKTIIGEAKYDIKELVRYLNNCFDASVRRIKDIRGIDESDLLHVRRKTSQIKGEEKIVIDNPKFYYHFIEGQEQLSSYGIDFLASIFLEKKDAHEFLKKQKYFHNDNEPKYRATLESFYCFRIKMPKPVIESTVDKNGLALDMLNELKKCPKELFEIISKEQKKKFRVKDSNENDEDDNEILMRRYSDRFAYFAMRYCDDNEVFPNIRFQIDLGKYYFRFYEKETIDGNIYQRALDKRLKTFGRIKDLTNKVEQEWGSIIKPPNEINNKQNEPCKADSTPHYNLVDNQIGFVISGDRALPDIKQADGKITLQKPDAWMSIYELPGMIFHGLKYGFDKTERLISIYIKKQRSICEKIRDMGTIPTDAGEYLPEALKGNEAKVNQKAEYTAKKLKRMLDDTKQRIDAINATVKRMADKSNKPGKKKYFDIRAGKLADFLARDFLAMQKYNPDKKGKDKITSINYQVLQATLAYYGAKKDTIRDMFRRIGLLDGENPHPFLNQLEPARYNSIAEFYTAYLRCKMQYLQNCQKDGDLDNYQFLGSSRQRYTQNKQDLKIIAKQLVDNPVNIPKDIFQKDIEATVFKENASLKKPKMNTAYMIKVYFERTYGRQQAFYFYEKTYEIVKKAAEYYNKGKNEKIKEILKKITAKLNYVEVEKIIKEIPVHGNYEPEHLKENLFEGFKDYEKNERLLRRYKVQDMIMFMMIQETLKEQLSIGGNALKLEGIAPDEKSPFTKPISCDTDISVPFNISETHHDKEYIEFIKKNYEGLYSSRGKKIILEYRLKSENRKLKDIGKNRRYVYDRRLPGLLIWKYKPNTCGGIQYDEIEKEVKAYEKQRKIIAEQIFMLENKAINSFGSDLEIELGKRHLPFNAVIDRIKSRLPDCKDKCDTLLNIRNAIYHNQFPVYEEAIQGAQGKNVADKMCLVTDSYVEEIMAKLS